MFDVTYQEATYQANRIPIGIRMLRKAVIDKYGVGCYGILSKRNVRGGTKLSVHAEGRAWDCKCNAYDPGELETGNEIARVLWDNKEKLGVQKIIWNKKSIDTITNEWQDYHGIPHTNHLHIELTRNAAHNLTIEQVREVIDANA